MPAGILFHAGAAALPAELCHRAGSKVTAGASDAIIASLSTRLTRTFALAHLAAGSLGRNALLTTGTHRQRTWWSSGPRTRYSSIRRHQWKGVALIAKISAMFLMISPRPFI
jgi:hypothetical protein